MGVVENIILQYLELAHLDEMIEVEEVLSVAKILSEELKSSFAFLTDQEHPNHTFDF